MKWYAPREVGGNEVDQPEMKSDGDHNANANGDRGGGEPNDDHNIV